MKISSVALFLVLASLTLVSCAKDPTDASETSSSGSTMSVSNRAATSATITWTAAVDSTTPSDQLQYKLVRSTVQSWNNADTAESSGTLVMDWTANVLTTNVTSLSHSTQYYFTLLVKNASGAKTVAGTFDATTTCTGKMMYLATASNGNLGGKAGADAICTTQKPAAVTGAVKAVLVDYTGTNTTTGLPTSSGRQACFGNCDSTNYYAVDWPLAANTSYCTTDLDKRVGYTSGSYKNLNVPNAGVLAQTNTNMFMGMHQYWGSNYSDNCNNWSQSSNTYVAGNAASVWGSGGYGFLIGGTPSSCSSAGHILCAEQ